MINDSDTLQARSGPSGGLVMQLSIKLKRRFHLPIGDHRAGFVTLVHFHAMRVEFVFLKPS